MLLCVLSPTNDFCWQLSGKQAGWPSKPNYKSADRQTHTCPLALQVGLCLTINPFKSGIHRSSMSNTGGNPGWQYSVRACCCNCHWLAIACQHCTTGVNIQNSCFPCHSTSSLLLWEGWKETFISKISQWITMYSIWSTAGRIVEQDSCKGI